MVQPEKYNASSSLAGYIFQSRIALLLGLKMLKKKPNGQISIEKFDDVAFETDNYAECLLQAKHHIKPKPLTDKSIDLWKTILIWIEQFQSGVLASADLQFNLITTATASSGSAMSLLRAERTVSDVSCAYKLLKVAAQKSKAKDSEEGRAAFLALNQSEAESILSRVCIIDNHPNLIDVMAEIEGELILLSPEHASTIAKFLEGWWLGRVGRCLVEDGSATIPVQHLIIKANEIGNQFKQRGLPVDDPETLGAKEYTADDEAANFVKQMRMIKLKESAVRRGAQDFYRASAQRSKWVRESLLLDGEASRYDRDLRDRFDRHHDSLSDEINSLDENSCELVGRKICSWATQQEVQFRNVVEIWITAGSFHSLADRLEIGWHPNYLALFSNRKVVEDA